MRLNLLFHDGVMEGAGRDAQVGDFHIHGDYSTTSGKCHCTKIYPHRPQVMHHVHYTGYNEGKGIWGVWEIAAFEGYPALHGGFYIWPEGWPDPTVGISTTENELPTQQPEVPSLDESLYPR
jgi:hypothetical protein